MQRIRKGDEVIVIAGKDKDKRGEVLRVIYDNAKTIKRVVVSGVNMVKKHVKPNPQKDQQGGIVEREAALHISNVALVNPTNGKADKVGFKFLDDGQKVRYFKSNGEVIDV